MVDAKIPLEASPEKALASLMEEGESDPKKLISGLRAKGWKFVAGKETQMEEEREGEPMPTSLDDAISSAVGDLPAPDDSYDS